MLLFTEIVLVVNLLLNAEISVNGYVQKDDLNSYVDVNWYLSMIITDLLFIIAFFLVIAFKAHVMSYIVALILLSTESFFWKNYRDKMLSYIQKCWFTMSLFIAIISSIISAISVFNLLIYEIIHSEF